LRPATRTPASPAASPKPPSLCSPDPSITSSSAAPRGDSSLITRSGTPASSHSSVLRLNGLCHPRKPDPTHLVSTLASRPDGMSCSGMPRLALLQSGTFPTKAEAFDHHETLIREAAAGGANIIVTQELFLTPYFCTVEDPALFDLADPLPG